MINYSELDPMEAHHMLTAERAAWRDREDAMMEAMNDTWHWRQIEDDYQDQLQAYYTARFAHQQHVYRLNQVLYGSSIACALRGHGEEGIAASNPPQPQPPPQHEDEEMACSPAPRSPLQPHAHSNLCADPHQGLPAAKKRSAPGDDGGWACPLSRQAKRHHH